MRLLCFKTLWGYRGSPLEATTTAVRDGYDGIEGPVPTDVSLRTAFAQQLQTHNLCYIAEVATTGSYVPDRSQTPQQHLQYLGEQLEQIAPLQPLFVTCLGGCDAWSLSQSLEFFTAAIAMAENHGVVISFETHRGRSLFNPWVTRDVVAAIPMIKLTFDVSHWYVVCEGLQAAEYRLMEQLADNAHHVHARVGYDQGPQVADPRQGIYRENLQQHLQMWAQMWHSQQQCGYHFVTATPEFGPDGYEYRTVDGREALVDVDDVNRFMCVALREKFAEQFDDVSTINRSVGV